jgi:quercetin dioxygenase-like cupin family protein
MSADPASGLSEATIRVRVADVPRRPAPEGADVRVVTRTNLQMMAARVKAGVIHGSHSHESEQMTYIIDGRVRVVIGAIDVVAEAGEIVHIPSNVRHLVEYLEDSRTVEVFSPPHPALAG